jgi:hypothetical protein
VHEIDTGALPPRPLAEDDVRFLARPVTCRHGALGRCRLSVVLLDPALAAVRLASQEVRAAVACGPVALVCDWWPEGCKAARDAVAPLLGRRPLMDAGLGSLPRPLVERFVHPHVPVTAAMERVTRAEPDPQSALARCRNAAVRLGAGDVTDAHVLLVVEHACARHHALRVVTLVKPQEVVVAHKSELLAGSLPRLGPGPWCVAFVVQPLVEYEERTVVHTLLKAGVSVARVVTHTWTPDGDVARVDGWAPGPEREAALRALDAILVI